MPWPVEDGRLTMPSDLLEHEVGPASPARTPAHQLGPQQEPVLTADDIAEVVSMWTGVPVMQMAQAESKRLLHMEDELQQVHHRPGRSHRGHFQGRPPGSRRVSKTRAAPSAHSFSWARPVLAKPS